MKEIDRISGDLAKIVGKTVTGFTYDNKPDGCMVTLYLSDGSYCIMVYRQDTMNTSSSFGIGVK